MIDGYTKAMLTVIAVFLAMTVAQNLFTSARAFSEPCGGNRDNPCYVVAPPRQPIYIAVNPKEPLYVSNIPLQPLLVQIKRD
jgi:hypothetical protein